MHGERSGHHAGTRYQCAVCESPNARLVLEQASVVVGLFSLRLRLALAFLRGLGAVGRKLSLL